jgi:bifunctional DNase/RNase
MNYISEAMNLKDESEAMNLRPWISSHESEAINPKLSIGSDEFEDINLMIHEIIRRIFERLDLGMKSNVAAD